MTLITRLKEIFSRHKEDIDQDSITSDSERKPKRKWFPRKAFAEAQELVKKYKIPENFRSFGEESIEVWNDRKVILYVPDEIFEILVKDLKPEYAYEHIRRNDPDAGCGPREVWFVTKNRVRIQAEGMGPGDLSFTDNVFYPSSRVQSSKVFKILGGKETTEEEIKRLKRKLGFEVEDPIINKWNHDTVSKVRLLSKKEIRKSEKETRKSSGMLIVVEKKPTKK